MKKVVIVHCWDGYPEYCWYPKVKSQLEEKGFEVVVPAFPETEAPNLEKWLPVLREAAGDSVEEVFLVGHSVGCITIMRYLESLPEGKKVGGAVLVAGFTENLGFEELKNFFTTDINFGKIKESSKGFVAIHSDDDPYVPIKYGDILKEKLGTELIVKHNFKHFSGPVDNVESCTDLPDAVEAVERLARN